METFTPYKSFTDHPDFDIERETALKLVDTGSIDPPLRALVYEINKLEHVFTLQCCHGHFVDEYGREQVHPDESAAGGSLIYRLAYLAVCLADNQAGRETRRQLIHIPAQVDFTNVQFGSAEWFWEQWPNSYVVQVMPERYKDLDKARIDYTEALELKKIHDNFFVALNKMRARLQC